MWNFQMREGDGFFFSSKKINSETVRPSPAWLKNEIAHWKSEYRDGVLRNYLYAIVRTIFSHRIAVFMFRSGLDMKSLYSPNWIYFTLITALFLILFSCTISSTKWLQMLKTTTITAIIMTAVKIVRLCICFDQFFILILHFFSV